jgi:hypothetical protein
MHALSGTRVPLAVRVLIALVLAGIALLAAAAPGAAAGRGPAPFAAAGFSCCHWG